MPTDPQGDERSAGIWLGMLVLYVVWGSTYIAIAVAVETIPPFLMAAVRFGLAGLILLAWTVARERRDVRWPTQREWRDSIIVGALLLGGGMGMVAFGEQTIPSGITALLIALMPVWIAVFGGVLLGERLPRLAVIGIAIGFVGVAVLVGPSAVGVAGALDPLGLAAVLLSPIFWALGSLFASHRAHLPRQPLMATGAQMVAGALVLGLMGIASGELPALQLSQISGASFAGFVYLTLVGSLVAFTTFGWLLRKAPLPLVATYAYVNPIVAVALSAILLHEVIEPRTMLAGTIIVVGVALIVTARGRMQRPQARAESDTTPAIAPAAVAN